MDLEDARVLLVSGDAETLERVHGYLSRAGARPQAASRAVGLAMAADRCDVAVLFDDYGEPDEFETRVAMLSRSRASLVIVTERTSLRESIPQAEIVVARSRLVRGWSLLDAIRSKISGAAPGALVDSTPELPFTD